METLAKRTLDRVRTLQAGRLRSEVSERSHSDVLGLLAGGAAASLRWLVLAGEGAGREIMGLGRALIAYRQARRNRGDSGNGPQRAS
jgi:hypothetical protein